METSNQDLMKSAKESLTGKWGLAIGTFLIFMLITGGLQSMDYFGQAAYIILAGSLSLGASIFALNISRGNEARLEQLFDGFKDFSRSFLSNILILVYVIVGLILLIVPGIIMGLAYSMTFFILADDKNIQPKEALEKSKRMTNGYKMKLFLLALAFMGLSILCVFTLGIGFLFLMPFMYVTLAKFYDDIKDKPKEVGFI